MKQFKTLQRASDMKHLTKILIAGLLLCGCMGAQRITATDIKETENSNEIACQYPFSPSNMLSLLVFYKKGMHYITHANETCRNSFANDLGTEVQSSFWVSDGCEKATLNDIEDALHHPEELQKRLDYN